jgi:hypothetical protein
MQFIADAIISIGAIALLGVGVYQGMNDRTASSTSLLGFGFLLVVLLVLAKFKRFKGFGFEAEMWEEKQIEAAALVDRLSLLSEAVAQQVALIASKLGLWDAGLSFPQMADLLDQTQRLLDAAEVLPDRRDDILAPLYQRIELNYWHAALFEAMRIDNVITMEVHNLAAFENAFRCPTWHVESAPLLAAHFAPLLRGEQVVSVSPDAGGAKRAEQFRQALEQLTGGDVGSAYMEKFRSAGIVSGELLAGDVSGKVAVIVDDLISTGGTLVRAATACRTAGATRVFAAAAHGLFVGGAPELFATPAIDGITVTSTVPPFRVPAEVAARRLTVLDASDAIARAITSCRHAN